MIRKNIRIKFSFTQRHHVVLLGAQDRIELLDLFVTFALFAGCPFGVALRKWCIVIKFGTYATL